MPKAPGELKAMTYSDMPKGNNSCLDLDRLWPRINNLMVQIEREEMILKVNIKQLEDMNAELNKLEGFAYNIYKARVIDHLTREGTAELLDTSTSTVDRVMAKIKKRKKSA